MRLKSRLKELKYFIRQSHIRIGTLVFLVTLASFGVGYLVGRDWTPAPIIIEKAENSK